MSFSRPRTQKTLPTITVAKQSRKTTYKVLPIVAGCFVNGPSAATLFHLSTERPAGIRTKTDRWTHYVSTPGMQSSDAHPLVLSVPIVGNNILLTLSLATGCAVTLPCMTTGANEWHLRS
ncbi:hypothetical protein BaRGS_00001321 [Batillaria attramentaria]|uniref:Uncharacterized protein n=1 Tax=Batillaria attramentaria TaxID=370345 RepID=A0ABD0M6V0_9CAEN